MAATFIYVFLAFLRHSFPIAAFRTEIANLIAMENGLESQHDSLQILNGSAQGVTITVINLANVRLNILAVSKFLEKSLPPFNNVQPGQSISFEALPGQWNFEVLIDDGEFEWDDKGHEGWRAIAKGTSSVVVKAVLDKTKVIIQSAFIALAAVPAIKLAPATIVTAAAWYAAHKTVKWLEMAAKKFLDQAFDYTQMPSSGLATRQDRWRTWVQFGGYRKVEFLEVVKERTIRETYANAMGYTYADAEELFQRLEMPLDQVKRYLIGMDARFHASETIVKLWGDDMFAIQGGFTKPPDYTGSEKHDVSFIGLQWSQVDKGTATTTKVAGP